MSGTSSACWLWVAPTAKSGASLFISTTTASVHVSNILAKLGVANRGAAVAAARARGWL